MPRYPIESLDRADGREAEGAGHRTRLALEDALRSSSDTILITGGSEPEKLQLLESLWKHPPRGFAPIPVPCRDATAAGIAARILAITRTTPVRVDAEAALARTMRTQSIRHLCPLLLVDDLDSVPPAALERLRSIADGSRVAVRWVGVGSESEATEAALAVLPRPVRVVAIDALPASPRRENASSEPAAVPRMAPEIPRVAVNPAPMRSPPAPVFSARSAAPPAPPAEDAAAPVIRPIRAGVPALPRPPATRPPAAKAPPRSTAAPKAPPRRPPPRREPRPPRPPLSTGARNAIVGGILACAALALLVERGPVLAAWAAQATEEATGATRDALHGVNALVADAWTAAGEATASLGSAAQRVGRRIGETTVTTAERAMETAREYTVREPEPPPPDVASPLPAVAAAPPPEPAAAPPRVARARRAAPPAPVRAPIEVGINSDPWSNVAVDGVDLGSTPISVSLSPGPHRFRAEMADGRIVEKEIEVKKGRREIVFR
jgi:hypothetical protein